MFDTPTPNRRMTKWEYENELEDAAIWDRYPRQYIKDKPFYKHCPEVPFYPVNFDLNAPK